MKKNKGFTLVEVIVILVILAILAAVLIPSLTTYIDKAKEKQITGNARAAFVAAQAMASEMYGLDIAITPLTGSETFSQNTSEQNYPQSSETKTDYYPTAVIDCTKYESGKYSMTGDASLELAYIVNLAQLTEVTSPTVKATFGEGKAAADIDTFIYSQIINGVKYTAEHTKTGSWVVTKGTSTPTSSSSPSPSSPGNG